MSNIESQAAGLQAALSARPARTRAIGRGVARLLRAAGYAVLMEMPFSNGRRADLVALGSDNTILVVEIKSGLADFRADGKWPDYRDYCDQFFFAVDADFPAAVFDGEAGLQDVGLIVADAYAADFVRDAPLHRLAPARRRALTIAFAQLAAGRLAQLLDPDCDRSG